MSRVLTSRCARSTALARTVADRAGQQIVRTVSPAHSFSPRRGRPRPPHPAERRAARQGGASPLPRPGTVRGCAPVPVAADIGSDTAERSAWHCPPLITRMSTGSRDPVTARRRRSRVVDRVGPGADPDRVGVVRALRVGAEYADVPPNGVSVAGDRCTCTDLARPPGAAYTGVIRSRIGVGDYLYGSPRTVGDTEDFEKTRPPTGSRTTPAGRLGGQRRAHWWACPLPPGHDRKVRHATIRTRPLKRSGRDTARGDRDHTGRLRSGDSPPSRGGNQHELSGSFQPCGGRRGPAAAGHGAAPRSAPRPGCPC